MNEIQKLQISSTVVGRDDEIHALRRVYNSVVLNTDQDKIHFSDDQDQDSTCWPRCPSIYVSGYSGVGKSALVQCAFEQEYRSENTYFAQGKFDLLQSHRPFPALADAINSLCAMVIEKHGKDECFMNKMKRQVRLNISAEGLNALTSMIPNLDRLLTGDVNATSSSISKHRKLAEDSNKSYGAIKQGFRVMKRRMLKLISQLVKDDEVLVLFIDDMQVSCSF